MAEAHEWVNVGLSAIMLVGGGAAALFGKAVFFGRQSAQYVTRSDLDQLRRDMEAKYAERATVEHIEKRIESVERSLTDAIKGMRDEMREEWRRVTDELMRVYRTLPKRKSEFPTEELD